MNPKDFAQRFRFKRANGEDGCLSCIYSGTKGTLDVNSPSGWCCFNDYAREPQRDPDLPGVDPHGAWKQRIGNGPWRGGASNVAVAFDGETICDLFVRLGRSAANAAPVAGSSMVALGNVLDGGLNALAGRLNELRMREEVTD